MVRITQPLRGLLVSLILAGGVAGQETRKPFTIPPREMGLDLPSGPITRGGGSVLTYDDRQQPVVGQVYVRVGGSLVVLLPDGQLVVRKDSEAPSTDRKFVEAESEKLAKTLVEVEFPNFRTRTTRNFIFLYNTSEEFAKGTSIILESMLPGMMQYAEAMKFDPREPDVPLIVVMFKTEDEFQRYRRMPPGVVAYYHTLSNRVFLYEQSKLGEDRPDLAVQQAISTIAHEGAHQILHNIGVQQRLSYWPLWLSEGLAEYFAPTSVGSRLKWKGAGQVNDLRMFELEQYVKSRATEEPNGRMIDDTVQAARLTSTGYATAWSLTHYLAKNRRAEFHKLVREASKLGPFETLGAPNRGRVAENLAEFKAIFGDDTTDLEKKLVIHLRKQVYTDPFKDQPHIVATFTGGDPKRPRTDVGTFHSQALAQKWVADLTQLLPEEQRAAATSQMRLFPNRAAAEAFARQARGGR